MELERVSHQKKVYFATYMCKKGLFLPQKSVGKAVFAFLVHFPEVQILVEISSQNLGFQVWTSFQLKLGVSVGTKTWVLEVIWIKICCFWPVEVSETHF